MNRRRFAKRVASTLGAAAIARNSLERASGAGAPEGEAPGVPFKLSVMLWTVLRDQPFEQRLEKVAEAGYHNVELVGEYKGWSEEQFRTALSKKRELGLTLTSRNNRRFSAATMSDSAGIASSSARLR